MRETVRSGRRENFYITDNSFIDHYAREMQPTDIAVYHALERYANCHTRSTFVGTAKIAEVLNVSQRTVQRSLKALEDLKLIRIVQTPTVKMYFIVQVPPRAKAAATPLFDAIEERDFTLDDTGVAWAAPVSRMPSPVSRAATVTSRGSDTDDGAYKDEQDLLNKTNEQDLFNKISDEENTQIIESARRIINILGLPDTLLSAAAAAVGVKVKQTTMLMDDIVVRITSDARLAERTGVSNKRFLEDFLAQTCAQEMLDNLSLPITNSLISTVTATVKAEAKDTGLSLEEAAVRITSAAIEDRSRGTPIDRFYFENVKWRSNVRVSKAEQRKLDNLEVNARAKQRLRERLGISRLDQR